MKMTTVLAGAVCAALLALGYKLATCWHKAAVPAQRGKKD